MKTIAIIKVSVVLILTTVFMSCKAVAQEKLQDKIADSNEILMEFGNMQESIPAELLEQSEGIIIIPNLINAGFGIGGKRGKGIAMVKDSDGMWSDPVFITMTGGSIGFQAGVQSIDLVLLFKDDKTLMSIGNGTFTLGGGVSVAAGPVGRSASASTDYKLDAEVYSYSRSKGLFAGISLDGTAVDVDAAANAEFYGKSVKTSSVLNGSVKAPDASAVKSLKQTLNDMY